MFSPYYAWARGRGEADPLDHCGLNVALYGEGGKRWALTERGRRWVRQEASALQIGPSRIGWDGAGLSVDVDEVTVPLPSRIRGRIRLHASQPVTETFVLDAAGRHRWRPVAPCSRVEVDLEQPALRWSGSAYLDTNRGDEPLEAAFHSWHWSRSTLADGSTGVLYDVRPRAGQPLSLALRLDPGGGVSPVEAPPRATLPTSRWGIARATRSDPGTSAHLRASLEDTPFYARSLVSGRLLGESVTAVHESLSLDRFAQAWVRLLLPFRMPRRG